MELRVRRRGGVGKFLRRLGRNLRRKADKTEEEIAETPRPEARTDAEHALWRAMGWDDDETEDALDLTRRGIAEAFKES